MTTKIEFKTIRTTRYVFSDGVEVGTIEPMLPTVLGKWAFIPNSPSHDTLHGKTIADVRSSIFSAMRRNGGW